MLNFYHILAGDLLIGSRNSFFIKFVHIYMLHEYSYSHVPVFGFMDTPPTQPIFCQHRHPPKHTHTSLQTASGAVAADIVEVWS